jgi:mRNA interferase MazF
VSVPSASQGDIWDCDLRPVRGHEQDGGRPCLVISIDALGTGPSELAIVVPITGTSRVPAFEVQIDPPEGGVTKTCYVQCYQVRTVSRERLIRRRGGVRDATLTEVIKRVRVLIKAP